MNKKLLIILTLTALSFSSHAGFVFNTTTFYNTSEDDADGASYSTLKNHFFAGATFLSNNNMAIGWDYATWTREVKGSSSATASDLSLTEMGPRIIFYMGQNKNFFVSFNWNPLVEGDRTLSTGVSEEITGSSLYGSVGYQAKLSKKFFFGGSLNYHTVSISKATVNSTESDVSHSYTDIYPALDFGMRFK